MLEASDLQPLTDQLWLWQAYNPALKSELFSSAVKTGAGLFLVDPIPLASAALDELTASGVITGIVVTNANHTRAADAFATRFKAPVFAAGGPKKISAGLTTIAIEGAAPGEIALHLENDGGTIITGDALINFEPFGFALLPPKYCSDQKVMRRSLRQLLDLPFERLLFAHGTPILAGARARLAALLANDR